VVEYDLLWCRWVVTDRNQVEVWLDLCASCLRLINKVGSMVVKYAYCHESMLIEGESRYKIMLSTEDLLACSVMRSVITEFGRVLVTSASVTGFSQFE
jgi:hypothetical protein